MEKSLREQLNERLASLRNERDSWVPHWKEISQFIRPRSGRYFLQDRNKGQRRYQNIYDSTATKALDVLAAGMMAGMTSPARPWFRLATPDPQLNAAPGVKQWLADATSLMQDIFNRSNTYRSLHSIYRELGAFGTAAAIVADDFENVINHYPLTVGEFFIAQDWKGQVCTLYREFEKTVAEVVKEFGYDKCSTQVKSLYTAGQLDKWVGLVHAIEPREDRDTSKKDAKNMPWRSVYFEKSGDQDQLLREGGFKGFPALAPRWDVIGGDIYGESPGMIALGDIKQLQHQQLRKATAIDYMTKPPLQVPTSMKNVEVNTLPGGINFIDSMGGANGGIRSAFQVNLDLSHLLADINDVRGRINSAFFADMFLMLSGNHNDPRMTATEVAERHEEKMLMLGPVVERLNSELLDPLIDHTFARMVETNILPPPPQALQGMQLNIEYVSVLAQAQQAIGVNGIDRFVMSLGTVAQMKPEVLDKLDPDIWADEYSQKLGVPPALILANKDVALIRQQRAQIQARQQQQAEALQQAETLQKLGGTPTTPGNAASDLLNQFTGYGG